MAFAGFDGGTFTNAPNAGVIFIPFRPFAERVAKGLSSARIATEVREQLTQLDDAFSFVLEPPSVPGIGTGGGLKLYVQDRTGNGLPALERATCGTSPARRRRCRALPRRSRCSTRTHRKSMRTSIAPRRSCCRVPIDRRVSRRCRVYMGSILHQRLQPARPLSIRSRRRRSLIPFRVTLRNVENLKTRNNNGDMVPIGSVATFRDTTGPFRVAALQPVSGSPRSPAPARRGFRFGPGDHPRSRQIAHEHSAAGLPAIGVDWSSWRLVPQSGKHRDGRVRAGGGVRVPAAGCAV